MPLTAASSLARHGRHRGPVRSLGYLGSATLVHGHQQQARGYRFGRIWTSYIDPSHHRDVCRRHGGISSKCADDFGRRLWDKHALVDNARSTLKRAVNNYWYPDQRGGQATGRYGISQATPKTPNNPEGIRPGQNIEDAERAPLEHLLFGGKKNRRTKKNTRIPISHEASSSANQSADYIIDPITNRKVFKRSPDTTYSILDGGVEVPIRKSKTYSPQFTEFKAPEVEPAQEPIFHDGPPPESELKKYGQVKIDAEPWNPASQPHEQASQSATAAPHAELLGTLNSEHKDVSWHRHHGIASGSELSVGNATQAAAEEDWPKYPDDVIIGDTTLSWQEDPVFGGRIPMIIQDDRARPLKHQESDEKRSEEEQIQRYEDLHNYGAVRCHEPDGKYKVEPGSPAADHQELGKYGAVRAHEPDGKYKVEQEAPAADQAELGKYGAVRSHEPDGKYASSYAEQPDPAELEQYSKPFLSHEPDGKYAAAYVKPKYDEEELAKYKPFRSHEPDGKYAVHHAAPKQDTSDLAGYGPFRSHEPDGKYAASNTAVTPEPSEVGKYQAFRSHEPDGKYALNHTAPVLEQVEARHYQAFRSHEPDGKYAAEATSTAEAQDLGNHEAYGYEDTESQPAAASTSTSAEERYNSEELAKYKAVRWNEPDGKPAGKQTDSQTLFEYDRKGEASTGTQDEKTPFRRKVEELMAQSAEKPDDMNADRLPSSHPSARNLTGNYVRDFPEEFARTWSTESAEATASKLSPEQKESGGVLEPSLDRLTKTSEPNPSSQRSGSPNPPEPTLYKVLVYDPTMQCIDIAETTSIVPDSAAPLTPAEVLLRISNPAKFFPHFAPLQAQGFEIVSGSGDVLIFRKVREAVADVGAEEKTEQQQSTESTSASSGSAVNPIDMTGGRRDYSYAVAAGRFASPTGFVNYDLPPPRTGPSSSSASSSAGSAQARAGADFTEAVDEEGRIARSASTSTADKWAADKKKRSVTKRVVVGAVWLAGISYSLGVVSEYFKTGGSDGKGPKGF